MTYTKTAWANGGPQPLSATNFNKMEQGIADGSPVDTIANLKAITGAVNGETREVLGYYAAGGDGGGLIRRNTSLTTFNEGTAFDMAGAAAAEAGGWERIYDGPILAEWFGAKFDNSTINTTALQNAINVAATTSNGAHGNMLMLPKGVGLTGKLTIPTGLNMVGRGVDATFLKLASAQNTAVLETENFSTLLAANSVDAPNNFRLSHFTVDGNKAQNSTAPACVRLYAHSYNIYDFDTINSKGAGLHSQWTTSASLPTSGRGGQMEAYLTDMTLADCDGNGLDFYGPHDAVITRVNPVSHAGKGFYFGTGSVASTCIACHPWSGFSSNAFHLDENNINLLECQGEGGATGVSLVRISGAVCTILGGRYFSYNASSHIAFEIDSSAGGLKIDTTVNETRGGVIKWNSGTQNGNGGITANINITGYTGASFTLETGTRPDKANVSMKIINFATGNYLVTPDARRIVNRSAAPTTGDWVVGDTAYNSAPAETGSSGSMYVILGWICTTAGTPGTWKQMRVLTGN